MPEFPFGGTLDEEMHVETFLNMRDWLKRAVERQGARMTGGGIGCGQADIDIELEGHHYNISIRPLPRRSALTAEPGAIMEP
jgi:hypothetical protein